MLKLITLNTQLLPFPAPLPVGLARFAPTRLLERLEAWNDKRAGSHGDSDQERRADEMATLLLAQEPDVVCLQEVFDHGGRRRLIARLSPFLPFIAEPHVEAPLPGNSGLLTFSRHPFAAAPKCHTWTASAGTDRFAAKGVMITTLDCTEAHAGLWSVIANVHLQAGAKEHAVRAAQLLELRAAIATVLEEQIGPRYDDEEELLRVLVAVGGDFNVGDGEREAMRRLLSGAQVDPTAAVYDLALAAADKPVPPLDTHADGRLDYWLMLGTGASIQVAAYSLSKLTRLELRPDGHSDHDALVAEINPVEPAVPEGGDWGLHALGDGIALASAFVVGYVDKMIERYAATEIALGTSWRPRTNGELKWDILRAGAVRSVKPVGRRHAMSDIVDVHPQGGVINDLRWLRRVKYPSETPRVEDVMPGAPGDTPILCFEAGATIDQLNAALGATDTRVQRRALLNQPGYGGLTFVGTMSVGGHGSSAKFGPLSDHVRALRIIGGGDEGIGDEWVCWPKDPKTPDGILQEKKMKAALVGLGLVGTIAEVIIEVQPGFRIAEVRQRHKWRSLVRELDDLVDWAKSPDMERVGEGVYGTPHGFEIWLNPYDLDQGVVGKRWTTTAPISRERRLTLRNTPSTLGAQGVLERWKRTGRLKLADVLQEQQLALSSVVNAEPVVMSAADGLSFGAPNNVDALAISVAVEWSKLGLAIGTLHSVALEMARADEGGPHGRILASPVGVRIVKQCASERRPYLSPQYEKGFTAMIEIPTLRDFRTAEATLTRMVHALVVDKAIGGRLHWGQYLPSDMSHVRARYDDMDAFLEARRLLDPRGAYNNAFSRRLSLDP